MRRILTGIALTCAVALSICVGAAPKPEQSLLGVRILSEWKTVLARHGQPTRVEAGPVTVSMTGPAGAMGGAPMMGMASFGGMTAPGGIMGGMTGAPGTPMMGGMASLGGAPGRPMMGGMSSAGGAPSSPMMGGMASTGGRSLPGLGGMGAIGRPQMGGMSSAGGGSSSMMRPPMPGGGRMMGSASMGSGMMSSMMRPPAYGGMPGSESSEDEGSPIMQGGMMGGVPGMGGAAYGGIPEAAEGEVSWIYEKGTDTKIFLFNSDGRVIQIQSYGYKAGARTSAGVGLGDPTTKAYAAYGFPEETRTSGNTMTLLYSRRANAAFQFADRRDGKGMRLVGITVALTEAPDPEKPE